MYCISPDAVQYYTPKYPAKPLFQVSNITTEDRGVLYTEKDLDNSLDKIETINFHEEIEVNGIRFWSYNAGHVLGAAMFMIEIAGVKLLYTGFLFLSIAR